MRKCCNWVPRRETSGFPQESAGREILVVFAGMSLKKNGNNIDGFMNSCF